jgi:hypothetical protein
MKAWIAIQRHYLIVEQWVGNSYQLCFSSSPTGVVSL